MVRISHSWPITLILLMISTSVFAQNKTLVFLEVTADEQYSKRFAFEVKEAIRGSMTLDVTDDSSAALQQLRLVILDTDSGVAYSKVRTFAAADKVSFPSYLTNSVGICGRDKFTNCARDILADLAEGVEYDKKQIENVWAEMLKNKDPKAVAPKK